MKTHYLAVALLLPMLAFAQPKPKKAAPTAVDKDKQAILADLDKRSPEYAGISKQIWDFAELGYQEEKSSALLEEQLKKEGFDVKTGVAGIPTAFVATYGSGKPVIGILGEYDALPGLATEAKPDFTPIAGQRGGHGCGHNLFGTASMAAAVEVKDWLKSIGAFGNDQNLRLPGRRRWIGQGIHGARRPVQRCRRGIALAPRLAECRRCGYIAGQ